MAGLVFSVILRDEHKQYFKVDAPFVMRKMWFWGDKGKQIQRISAGGEVTDTCQGFCILLPTFVIKVRLNFI